MHNQDDITIDLSDSEDLEYPSKKLRLTAMLIEDDMSWLKKEVISLRGDVRCMLGEIKSLEKSIARLCLAFMVDSKQ